MYGHIRRTEATSDAWTITQPRNWRIRFGDFLVRMWRLNACLRLKPFAVFLKRFAAPRLVLSFIMTSLLIISLATWRTFSPQSVRIGWRWDAYYTKINCAMQAIKCLYLHPQARYNKAIQRWRTYEYSAAALYTHLICRDGGGGDYRLLFAISDYKWAKIRLAVAADRA